MPKSQKYLTISDVRVFYNKNTHQIELTSGDPLLLGSPFQVKIKPGTPTDVTLRGLLEAHNAIDSETVEEFASNIPNGVNYPVSLLTDEAHDPKLIPLGQGAKGLPVFWNTNASGHALFVGQPGSGKSLLTLSVIQWVMNRPKDWSLLWINPLGEWNSDYNKFSKGGVTPVSSLESAVTLLRNSVDTLKRRLALIEARQHELEKEENPKQWQSMVIVIDGASAPWAQKNVTNPIYKALQEEFSSLVSYVARLGRAANVHLLVTTQSFSKDELKWELLANLSTKVILKTNEGQASLLGVSGQQLKALKEGPAGRAIIETDEGKSFFQIFYFKEFETPGMSTEVKNDAE